MTTSLYQKGSEWKKWDLHVHSPKVYLNNQYGECSCDEFVKKISESGVAAVGLTNYFRFDSEELNEVTNKLRENGVVVFPNIEFRTQPPNKDNEEMHVHVIFSDQVATEKINSFLGRLKTLDGKYCKDLTSEEIEKTTISIDTLKSTLAEDEDIKHSEDYLIIACPRGQGSFRPSGDDDGRGNNYAIVVDKYTDVLFGNEDDTEFFLGSDRYVDAKPKPVLLCSDAHKLDEIGSKFTWIKSEPSFEGLKQIIYDPKSRVAIQEDEPIQPTNIIEKIKIDIPADGKIRIKQKGGSEKEESFCFSGTRKSYSLSPYFNCFIGGRGSGKSTVLNFLGQHSRDPRSSQSFWDKLQPTFDVSSQEIFSFDGVEVFEFIGQSEVESFATNQEAFTDAIYQRANLLCDGLLEEKAENLSLLLTKLRSFQGTAEDLSDLEGNKRNKEKEKKTLESGVKVTKSQQYSELVEKITAKSNEKQDLESWRNVIDELRDSIDGVNEEHFITAVSDENSDIEEAKKEVAALYKKAYKDVKGNIDKATEILNEENFSELIKKEDKLADEIKEHEKDLSEMLKKAGLSEENILQVKSAPQKIVKIDGELSKIKTKIEDRETELTTYDAILQKVESAKDDYEKVINDSITPLVATLEDQAKENERKDIKNIGMKYYFDEQQAWKRIVEEFYKYFSDHYRDGERQDLLKAYIIENKEVFLKDKASIEEHLSKETKRAGYLKFLKDVFESDTNFQIFRTIRDEQLRNVQKFKRIQVLYDDKDIERASFGQKCTAVMVILLLFGNYPLIIDEPEAHLDSSLIANYLVPLIKRTKNNRQIIFATHNANFVVNGDSEKIFILKNDTGHTEVIETTIEDISNRDELLKLEGGREAFRKRGEKLHI